MTKRQRTGALWGALSVIGWSILPVSAKGLTGTFDPYTLNFFRFLFGVIPLGLYFLVRSRNAFHGKFNKRAAALLFVAVVALLTNNIFYMIALNHISASTSQIIIQIGPLLLLLSSVLIFKERFTNLQWAGCTLLVLGFLLFFNASLFDLFDTGNNYGRGVFMMAFAATVWAVYGIAQKPLVGIMSPMVVLLCCYSVGVVMLYPFADTRAILTLGVTEVALLLMCTFSSLFAYVAFAESMAYWEASKTSALLALIPLITIALEMAFATLLPTYIEFQTISFLSLAGALVVVAGTLTITMGGAR